MTIRPDYNPALSEVRVSIIRTERGIPTREDRRLGFITRLPDDPTDDQIRWALLCCVDDMRDSYLDFPTESGRFPREGGRGAE